MRLEIERRKLAGYARVFGAGYLKEENGEAIVPDSEPDILRVVDTRAAAALKDRRVTEGGVEFSGEVRVSVIYEPENEPPLRRVGVSIPFSHVFEKRGVASDGAEVLGGVKVIDARAHAVNPRKVQVRVTLALDCEAFAPVTVEIAERAVAEEGSGVETLTRQAEVNVPVAVAVKSFGVSDRIELPSGRPEVYSILHAGAEARVTEVKPVGAKAVVKGSALISLLYLGESGLASHKAEVQFSNLVELGAADASPVITKLYVTSLDLALDAPSRAIDADFNVEAQVISAAPARFEMIADAYGTKYHVCPEPREFSLFDAGERFSNKVQVREQRTIVPAPHSVTDVSVTLSPVSAGAEKLSATARVSLITQSEDGASHSETFAIVLETDKPGAGDFSAAAYVAGDVFAGLAGDGAEVRFNAVFEGAALNERFFTSAYDIKADWETPLENKAASVTLRRVDPSGERLWDVAKRCGASIKDITSANALTDGEIEPGGLLLIPRAR